MDEVDFTILAATSVLGDLIEKCPPAEACRDAFDRMSKATVQMCMSTTGFNSTAQGLNPRRPHSQGHQNAAPPSDDGYFSGKNQFKRQRPKPQFDMGLNDLLSLSPSAQNTAPIIQTPQAPFHPDSQSNSSSQAQSQGVKLEYDYSTQSGISSMGGRSPPMNLRQNTSTSQSGTGTDTSQRPNIYHSPTDYAISPPLSSLDTSAIDPSLLPSSQTTFSTSNLGGVQQSYGQNPYQELQFANLAQAPGMDFLQGVGWEGGDGVGMNGGNGGWGGDLGMGLGWEGLDHDFSEGGNGGLDLFEGFFFGGSGNF
jgi:hypothetical protein